MERLNQWLTLIANVGVVAGIVFLAYEIRVNTQALSATTATSYLQNWIESSAGTATDPGLVVLHQAASQRGWEAVPVAQRGLVVSFRLSQLKAAEFAHFQWTEGLLDERLWASNDVSTYQYFWSFPDAMEVYKLVRNNFYSGFQQYADQMIADICSRKTCRSDSPFPPESSDQIEATSAWAARGR